MKSSKELTPRQAEVFAMMRRYERDNKRPPTFREMAAALGIKSLNGVTCHLKALQLKGVVERSKFGYGCFRTVSRDWEAEAVALLRELRELPVARMTVIPFLEDYDRETASDHSVRNGGAGEPAAASDSESEGDPEDSSEGLRP
jgi:SOS-response transcriptional repressor LexA